MVARHSDTHVGPSRHILVHWRIRTVHPATKLRRNMLAPALNRLTAPVH